MQPPSGMPNARTIGTAATKRIVRSVAVEGGAAEVELAPRKHDQGLERRARHQSPHLCLWASWPRVALDSSIKEAPRLQIAAKVIIYHA